MSDEPTPEPQKPVVPLNGDGSPMTRLQMKEACRLAYCSGRARLVDLCVKYQLPYDTLAKWSSQEAWGVTAQAVLATADRGTAIALANWLVEQREEQVRRSITRGGAVQAKLDLLLGPDTSLSARDLRDIATAEERMDIVIRRNLGLEDGSGKGGPLVNVNALGSVEISG